MSDKTSDKNENSDSQEVEKGYVPSGITSFSALQEYRKAQEQFQKTVSDAEDYMMLVYRIFEDESIVDKSAAMVNLANEFSAVMKGDGTNAVEKAVWSGAFVNDLPDSSFLYIESGGEKDDEGKTKPRSLRHFPYKDSSGKVDLPHLRNAIARIPQANIPQDVKDRLQAKARRMLENINKEWLVEIDKAYDAERKLVYGVVLKPDVVDAQGDIASTDDIEKAAHHFFVNSRIMDYRHEKEIDKSIATPVESYIAPVDFSINGKVITKGSWVMVTYVPDDEVWSEIKKGKLLSYSIRGTGYRHEVD